MSSLTGGVYPHKRLGVLTILSALVVAGALMSTGLGRSEPRAERSVSTSVHVPQAADRIATTARTRPFPPLLVNAPVRATARWTMVARVRGEPAAWLAQRSGVTLMRFDQNLLHVTLHAGPSDGGMGGWIYGDQITQGEIHLLVAAFNGGFKLSYPNVGFMSGGHFAVPLARGLASIVTYTDGSTDIGAWQEGVPSVRKTVFSVLQNQRPLVRHGAAAASTSDCILACWGGTVGGRLAVARSGLGVTASGQLVWAAGEQLLPAELASALIKAGAVRAIELDINPDWVAGYLYVHHPTGPAPVPVVPGQVGIAGQLLEPYTRDFLAIVAD